MLVCLAIDSHTPKEVAGKRAAQLFRSLVQLQILGFIYKLSHPASSACWPTENKPKTGESTEKKKTTLRTVSHSWRTDTPNTHTHILKHTHTCAHFTDIWPADKTVNQHKQQQQQLPIVNPNVLPSELRASWEGIADLSHVAGEEGGSCGAPAQRVANWFVAHWLKGKLHVATCDSMRIENRTEPNRSRADAAGFSLDSRHVSARYSARFSYSCVYKNVYL